MANLTSVGLTSGVPSSGTGTVSTLDNIIGTAGSGSAQVLTIQGNASGTAIPVSGTFWQTTQPVSLASVPSHAVTNAGTFAVQVTSAPTTAVTGTFFQATQPVSNAGTFAVQVTSAPSTAVTNAGTFAVQSTIASAASWGVNTLGSTTSGQSGTLALGAVTTAAPTYTTAQTNALSLDTSGCLRVNVVTGGGTGGTSSTVGSAAPSTATAIGFSDGTNLQLGVIKAASTAPVATDRAIVVAISPNSVNANGLATPANSAPVVTSDGYSQYETVAASQTAQVLGATGATGDYLAGVLVFPGTAGCGVVTILDNATTIGTFAGGGTTALPSLVPFVIPVGCFSTSGAWKITTGANVTCVGIGKFT